MRKKYYLIEVQQGLEPISHGPFQTESVCDNEAKKLHKQLRSNDSLFWADIDESGGLNVGSYIAGFFIQE